MSSEQTTHHPSDLGTPVILRGMARLVPGRRPGDRSADRAHRKPVDALVGFISSLRGSVRQRRGVSHASTSVPAALAAGAAEDPDSYTVLRSHHEVVVARGSMGGSDVVIRVGRSETGGRSLQRHADMLEQLHTRGGDASWVSVVPEVLQRREVDGQPCAVETCVPGIPASDLAGEHRSEALEATLQITSEMHRDTAAPAVFDEKLAIELIDEPVLALLELPGVGRYAEGIEQLRVWLRDQLLGHSIELCCTHGDLWAGNVMVAGPDEPSTITGIIDWEDGRTDGLGELDDAHLWLTEQPGEMGAAALGALGRPELWPSTTTSESGITTVGSCDLPARAVIALAWLGHVAAGAGRTEERTPGRLWIRRNVVPLARAAMTPDHPIGIEVRERPPAPAEPSQNRSPAPQQARSRRSDVLFVGVAALSAVLWTVGAWGADPTTMTEYGLGSLMTPAMVAALLLLSVGFVAALRRRAPGWVLGTYVVVLIGLIHGTPAVLYDTLRYSWSWKHVGIVEFILRNGTVDTTAQNLPIYHSWPGMFAGSALLGDMGAASIVRIAIWAPVAFNLGNFLALRYLYRSLRTPRVVMWLAVWVFFVTNWVGQDYFSPQAMAFLLYLLMIGTVLRGFRRPGRWSVEPGVGLPRSAAFVVFCLTMLAIAGSHQITPFVAIVSLSLLWLTRQVRGWYLPVLAAGSTFVWAFTVGYGVTSGEVDSIVDSFGQPLSNAAETLSKGSATSDAQLLSSWAGRLVIVAVVLLAGLGALKALHRRRLDPVLIILAAAPAVMPLVTEFGGEVLFRVFLFAIPTLALLCASALVPESSYLDAPEADSGVATRSRWSIWRTGAVTLAVVVLATGFVLAYYGKDQQYYFTEDEIAAALWVADNSVDHTLLVEGTTNYPSRSRNQELFVHVPISVEPEQTWQGILDDPAARLERWLSNPEYGRAYVLITRGMKIDADVNGPFPTGALQELEDSLRAAPEFRVAFETPDGVVFELKDPEP